MLNGAELLGDSADPTVIGDTEGGHADTRAHIDIAFALVVKDQGALTRDDFDGKASIGIGDIGCIFFLEIAHNISFLKGEMSYKVLSRYPDGEARAKRALKVFD